MIKIGEKTRKNNIHILYDEDYNEIIDEVKEMKEKMYHKQQRDNTERYYEKTLLEALEVIKEWKEKNDTRRLYILERALKNKSLNN